MKKTSPKAAAVDSRSAALLRNTILEAAITLFAEHGYDSVSTRDIAEKIGIKQSALYYYFKDKDQIYRDSFERANKFMMEHLMAALTAPVSPEKRIRRFFYTAILLFQGSTSEARLVDRELMKHGEEGSTLFPLEIIRLPHATMTSIVRELAPDCPAEKYAWFFFGLAYGLRKQRVLQLQLIGLDDVKSLDELVDATADWALRAVLASPEGVNARQYRDRIAELEAENARLRNTIVDLCVKVADPKGDI